MEKKINDFIVFCLEIYKFENGLSGEEVYQLFENYGVLNYLKEGYEVLHTQGDRWLINDINEYLKNRGYK